MGCACQSKRYFLFIIILDPKINNTNGFKPNNADVWVFSNPMDKNNKFDNNDPTIKNRYRSNLKLKSKLYKPEFSDPDQPSELLDKRGNYSSKPNKEKKDLFTPNLQEEKEGWEIRLSRLLEEKHRHSSHR